MKKINFKTINNIDISINKRYSDRFVKFGPKPISLGWDKYSNQKVRFQVFLNSTDILNKSILDIGCGLGDLLKYIDSQNIKYKKYVGIDINENFINYCKNKYNHQKFLKTNFLTNKNLKKFDIVCMFGLLNLKIRDIDNYNFAFQMINSAYKLCNDKLVFDMISDQHNSNYKKEKFINYYNSSEIINNVKKISKYVILRNDYKPIPQREFMIIMSKNPWKK